MTEKDNKSSSAGSWRYLAWGCLIMLGAGTGYLFPLYAPLFRDQFGFSQTQTNIIASCQKLGSGLSFFSGTINDRYGSHIVSLLALICCGTAYSLLWGMGRSYITENIFLVAFLFYMEGVGHSGLYYAGFSFSQSFPVKRRGVIIGTLVSSLGLAAAVWSQCYRFLFAPDIVSFLGFMSFASGSLGVIGYFKARPLTSKEIPVVISEDTSDSQTPQIPPSMLLRMPDFWILAIIVFVLTGSGATVLVNMGSMVLSVGGDVAERNSLVFLLSVSNCLGRLLFGYLSDYYAHKLSKVSFLCVLSVIMAFSQLFFAAMTTTQFYWLGSLVVGIAYGGVYSIFPNIILTMFGNKHFGTNMAAMGLSTSGSTIVMASLVAGLVYESYADQAGYCVGSLCYGLTFFSNFCLCTCSSFLSLMLTKRLHRPIVNI